jgi:hypothetical protein
MAERLGKQSFLIKRRHDNGDSHGHKLTGSV